MKVAPLSTCILLGLLGAGLVFADAAARAGRSTGNAPRPAPTEAIESFDIFSFVDALLTADHITTIVSIIYGHDAWANLINEALRIEILSNINSARSCYTLPSPQTPLLKLGEGPRSSL